MKRKLLLSLFVLMLSCIITLGVVGCDSRPYALEVTGADAITFTQYEQGNSSSTKDSYSDTIQKEFEDKLKGVKFVLKNKSDGSVKEEWGNYEDFHKAGGKVSGVNLRNKPGTYEMTFTIDGIESAKFTYTIAAKGGTQQKACTNPKADDGFTAHNFEGSGTTCTKKQTIGGQEVTCGGSIVS